MWIGESYEVGEDIFDAANVPIKGMGLSLGMNHDNCLCPCSWI